MAALKGIDERMLALPQDAAVPPMPPITVMPQAPPIDQVMQPPPQEEDDLRGIIGFSGVGGGKPIVGTGKFAGLTGRVPSAGRFGVRGGVGNYDPMYNAQMAILDKLRNVMLGVDTPNFRVQDGYASIPAPWLGEEYQNKQAATLIGLLGALGQSRAPELQFAAAMETARGDQMAREMAEEVRQNQAEISGRYSLQSAKLKGALEAIRELMMETADPQERRKMLILMLGMLRSSGDIEGLPDNLFAVGSSGQE